MNRKLSIVLALIVLSLLVAPVRAGGSTQVSGIAYIAGAGECLGSADLPRTPDLAVKMTGYFDGCFYVFVETYECRPSGTYMETGFDIYVGDEGTFVTPYRYTAKFDDCPTLAGEKFGRCQHPFEAGSGTGDYDGVTGRLAFRDDVETGAIPYRGHLKW